MRCKTLNLLLISFFFLSTIYRLELGAGGGLVGLAVAKQCVYEETLYITDQADMFSLMEHNIALNALGGRVNAAILNW